MPFVDQGHYDMLRIQSEHLEDYCKERFSGEKIEADISVLKYAITICRSAYDFHQGGCENCSLQEPCKLICEQLYKVENGTDELKKLSKSIWESV
jgi:hypothetical protein